MATAAGGPGAAPSSLPVLRLKVLSMGDSQVGKSCLIKRYCENKFVAKYVATIGIDYGVRPLKLGGRDVRVNFFDMSGQEPYLEIRNEFYKDASAAIVVFAVDNRDSFDHLPAWLSEAKAAGAPAGMPTFLVANKCENRRLVTPEEGKRFAEANGLEYYEVSASSGHEVAATFDALFTRAVAHLTASAAAGGGGGGGAGGAAAAGAAAGGAAVAKA